MNLNQLQDYARDLSKRHMWEKEGIEKRQVYLESEVKEVEFELHCIKSAEINGAEEERARHIKALGHELFDVLWNVADIANRYGIDLGVAAVEKMAINSDRQFSTEPVIFKVQAPVKDGEEEF